MTDLRKMGSNSLGMVDQRADSFIKNRKRKLWKILRITVFMIRRGFLMRKEDLHLLMKKGKMAVGRNIKSLAFNHKHVKMPGYYEFSCSNSPAFRFGKMGSASHRFNYFSSCIHPSQSPSPSPSPLAAFAEFRLSIGGAASAAPDNNMESYELAAGEALDLVSTPTSASTASVAEVDKDAEEFIANFYREIKFERQVSFLRYQEMLDRGAS